MKLSMHQQSIAYKAFRGPKCAPTEQLNRELRCTLREMKQMHLRTMPDCFFLLFVSLIFSVKQHKKWQRHHPAEAVAVRERGSTKEQLMRNCRCIIAEHAAGAAQPSIKKQLMPHKCAWHA